MKRIKVGLVLIIMGLVISIIFINKPNNTYKTVEEHIQEGNTIAFMKQEKDGTYTKVDDIPSGYDFNSKKSICSNNAEPTWENGKLKINNLTTKNTACYLYFDRKKTAEEVLSYFNLEVSKEDCPTVEDGQVTVTGIEDTKKLICSAPDDTGESYYFRGITNNNWVKFGQTANGQDIWWRIIRINGDGSIRLIYAGEGLSVTGNGMNALNSQAYNTGNDDNTYVGYYYGTKGGNNFSATHSNSTPSSIATATENWFTNNTKLDDAEYITYIDENAGFCNNRQISSKYREWWTSEPTSGVRGTSKIVTAYKGFYKTFQTTGNWKTDKQYPDLRCSSNEEGYENNADYQRDYYTWKGHASQGNQALYYPVGQITMDEVILAGGFGNQSNTGYWLYTGEWYWTMTPRYMSTNGYADVFYVGNNGYIASSDVNYATPGARPAINLKSNTLFEPSNNQAEWGTKENPYIVEVTE